MANKDYPKAEIKKSVWGIQKKTTLSSKQQLLKRIGGEVPHKRKPRKS